MGRRNVFVTEAEMAGRVVAWLSNQHWEVYQEVQVSDGGPIADIVATQGPRLIVVETKLGLGLKVIQQAVRWNMDAHMVYVAVPILGYKPESRFAVEVARKFGIGVLEVSSLDGDGWGVRETSRPTLNRRAWVERIRKVLRDQHKTFAAAGNPNGRRWTPFQSTCAEVANYANKHPGATLKEVVDNIKTHYGTPATARVCLAKWAELGKVPGVRLEKLGRAWRVYPTSNGARQL